MASESSETEIIKEGDYVIVKTDGTSRLVDLQKKKPHFLVKRKINLFAAVGHPYGSYFEIKQDGDLKRVLNSEANSVHINAPFHEDTKDNRSLFDSGNNQKLTTSDIESFKASGMSGQEVVQKIVENSTSFHEKTAFAKEKYLKKKQKKYMKYLRLLKPNVRLLAEMYYTQGPLKICNLRIDSLSQMLNFCNVMSGGSYMVVETVIDLLITAVIDRLGSEGCAVQLHMKPFSIQPNRQVLNTLSISEKQLQSILHNIDMSSALSILQNGEVEDMIIDSTDYVPQDVPLDVERTPKSEKKEHVEKTKEILKLKNMDGLLVAVKNHPANVLPLLDFLSISRPFAIFSMFQEPLVDCYVKLKARGDIILLNISDTWFRTFQVMPDRTHPCYTMSGHGGFLLTGFKVAPKP